MCFIVVPKPKVMQLCIAAGHINELLGDGTLNAALGGNKPDACAQSATAFDRLEECATAMMAEQREISPFLRYRQEILADTVIGKELRCLVIGLYIENPIVVSRLLGACPDDHHTRIVLECIAAYANNGERDTFVDGLVNSILDMQAEGVES